MIIAVTAHFVVAPLGQRTSSHLPESMEHEGVNPPSCLQWEAAPLQGYTPAPSLPEVGHEGEQSLQQSLQRVLGSKINYRRIRQKSIQRA